MNKDAYDNLLNLEYVEQCGINKNLKHYKNHLKATSFGYIDKNNENKTCKCCQYPVKNYGFNIFSDSDEFSCNGSGYSLFFKFIAFLIILLIFPFSFLAAFNAYENYKGNYCKNFEKPIPISKDIIYDKTDINLQKISQIKYYIYFYCYSHIIIQNNTCKEFFKDNCYSDFDENCQESSIDSYNYNLEKQECDDSYYYLFSFVNSLNQKNSELYNMINVFTCFLLYLLIEKFHNYYQNKILFYDQENLTCADYSLEISKINLKMNSYNNYNEFYKSLKLYLKNKIDENIIDIHPIFNLNSILHLKKKLTKIKSKINIIMYNDKLYNKDSSNKINELKLKINNINNVYLNVLNEFFNCDRNFFTGFAIVCFDYPANLNNFLKKVVNEKSLFSTKQTISQYNNLKINFTKEPSDIIWNNFCFNKFNKFIRKTYSTSFLVTLTFILFMYILYLKIEEINKEDEEVELFENNIFISLIIIISDFLIEEVTIYFGKFNKPRSKTKKFSVSLKSIYKFKFFIYSLISLLASLILFNFYGKEGLISSLNFLFLAEMVVSPLKEILLNFDYIILKIKRWILSNYFDLYPQTELKCKKIFTNERFEIEIYYSDSMKLIASALFYTSIFPPIILYCTISLIINYILFKYVLIARSNKKINFSSLLTKELINELEYLLLIFSIGLIVKEVLESYIRFKPFVLSPSALFCLGFSIFNIILPIEHLDSYFKEDLIIEEEEKNYKELVKNNFETYKNFNPLKEVIEDYERLFVK